MINNIYSIKNILSKRFNDIFEYPTDEFAKQRVTEIAQKNPEYIRIDESELYRVGCIDVENGIITPLSTPVLINLEKNQGTEAERIEKDLTNKKTENIM